MDEANERTRDGAVEALRSVSGLSLVVFPADRVRAWLPADRRLADLSPEELTELREGAAPLTVTETLLEVDGETWLVQQTGPAWAEPSEASADLCGLAFTRLDGSQRRHVVEGGPPGPLPDETELRRTLETARGGEGPGSESDDEPGSESDGARASEGSGESSPESGS